MQTQTRASLEWVSKNEQGGCIGLILPSVWGGRGAAPHPALHTPTTQPPPPHPTRTAAFAGQAQALQAQAAGKQQEAEAYKMQQLQAALAKA